MEEFESFFLTKENFNQKEPSNVAAADHIIYDSREIKLELKKIQINSKKKIWPFLMRLNIICLLLTYLSQCIQPGTGLLER